ncbi:alpha/beta-hydrolase [Coprinellus micaceus]|uniref:Alpha/beta-hydrolase n=1 Tax=Coprinellus micaceus TaxID=71717 RepID=A0A4Y7TXX3_COPMI|nr:alpha/beta-hydrolase [Coprinellus micaceus]
MLGYGGTDKPRESSAYVHSLLAKDLLDILDYEKVNHVFAIGHDWGSKTASVLANLYPDRFLGFGFFALGYMPPITNKSLLELSPRAVETVGYENFGYFEFYTSPDAEEVVNKHLDSNWDICYAADPRLWRYVVCPVGAVRVWLESDSRTPRATFVGEIPRIYEEAFKKNGLHSPLNYYRIAVNGESGEDSKVVPPENYTIQKPVFFGGTEKDMICTPSLQQPTIDQLCPRATSHIFNAGHWVMAEVANEVNETLEKWVESVMSQA